MRMGNYFLKFLRVIEIMVHIATGRDVTQDENIGMPSMFTWLAISVGTVLPIVDLQSSPKDDQKITNREGLSWRSVSGGIFAASLLIGENCGQSCEVERELTAAEAK
jgi:hypothetical protein